MKKGIILLIIIVITIFGGILVYNFINNTSNTDKNSIGNNTQNENNYQAQRSNTTEPNNLDKVEKPKVETEISSFSTKIHNKDSERQNNITITCQNLDGTEVQPGQTFSFCDVVGKATSAKGYKEADVYVDGKKEQALGGGNCQVSTTLYNAVLKIPELEIVERHKHSGHVPYIEEGKDSAVAYGSYDFKFKNNSDAVIKVIMENTTNNVTAKIIKIS